MTTDKHQPTAEQSLHSIALSLIELNKRLENVSRVQKKAAQHAKRTAGMPPLPKPPVKKRGMWDGFKRWLVEGGPRSPGLGGGGIGPV
jgi:hypothetical protein